MIRSDGRRADRRFFRLLVGRGVQGGRVWLEENEGLRYGRDRGVSRRGVEMKVRGKGDDGEGKGRGNEQRNSLKDESFSTSSLFLVLNPSFSITLLTTEFM